MEQFTTSDGLKLAYRIDDFTDPWRKSDTLVLLHAAQGCHERFRAWVPHLARQVRLVRPDLRGHGRSAVPADGPSIERLVADVVELAGHLGAAQVHLAGSSAGAMIAMAAAIAHPDRVASLAIFAATAGMKGTAFDVEAWMEAIRAVGVRAFLAQSLWHRFDVARTDPRLIEWWLDLAEAANRDPAYAARFIATMRALDLRCELHRIGCPAMAVVPDADPEHQAAEYAILQAIPGLRFQTVAAAFHNITDAMPDQCASALRSFLTDVAASRADHEPA